MSATTAPAGRLEIVSDAICPWCWIGKAHLDAALAVLAAEGLVFEIGWLPFQLNPDMPPEGVDRRAYRSAKFGSWERSQALDAQVAEAGRAAGLDFRHDLMTRTPNTVEAHRLIRLAGRAGRQHAVVERLFRAYFQEGEDIGEPAVLARLGAEAGLAEETIAAFAAGEAAREEVVAESRALAEAGITGVPSFLLDRHLVFSGAMPVLGRHAGQTHGRGVPPRRRPPARARRRPQPPPARRAISASAQARARKPVKSRMARRRTRPGGGAGTKRRTGQGGIMGPNGPAAGCGLMALLEQKQNMNARLLKGFAGPCRPVLVRAPQGRRECARREAEDPRHDQAE
jgi:predicted DsbA family dithiol-disulfide isomerase